MEAFVNYNEVIFTTFQKLIKDKEITPLFYKNKDIIFKEGSLCKDICYILDGEVEINTLSYSGSIEVISLLVKHNFFGEFLIFQENGKYLGDVIAKGNVALIKISKEMMLDLMHKNKEFLEAYISFISKETYEIKQQVKLLSHKNALNRVIYYLENHATDSICILESVASLAKEINLPRETVSRTLTRLENEGFLYKNKNIIKLLK